MFSKVFSKSAVSVLGIIFALSLCIGLSGAIADDGDDCNLYGCDNDCKFTTDFLLEDCKFKTTGINPYFILKPGYRLVLEGEDDGEDAKVVITVLKDTKWIYYNGRKIKTRVVEERESKDGVVEEVSRNYFAICDKTNDVLYFGELSRECDPDDTGGFHPGDDSRCADDSEPETDGSWEAGENEAQPGIIMPGSFLLGAKYFQEIAEEDEALDRGQNVKMGLTVKTKAGTFEDCVKVIDTNSAEEECTRAEGDPKKYCPGVGLVQDEDLKLVEYGFVDSE